MIKNLLEAQMDMNLNISEKDGFYVARWSFKTRSNDGAITNVPPMFIRKSVHNVTPEQFEQSAAEMIIHSVNHWTTEVKEQLTAEKAWASQKKQTAAKKEAESKEKLAKAKHEKALKEAVDKVNKAVEETPNDKTAIRKTVEALRKLQGDHPLIAKTEAQSLNQASLFQ